MCTQSCVTDLISVSSPNLTNQQPAVNAATKLKLRIMSVNCCSLRSQSKRARLSGLITEHQPDIILGCESHFDNSFVSSGVFPDGFNISRKDRSIGGGGVFVAVSSRLAMCDEPLLDADTELGYSS